MVETKEKKYIIESAVLMTEWNWEKNNELDIDPAKITRGCTKKVWWICRECAYEWQATIGHRANVKKPTGCPRCSAKERARLRKEKLILSDNLTLKYPVLLQEWDYEKNKDLSPNNITKGSHQNIWWKCQYGHSWQTLAGNRIKGHGCPYCSGRYAIKNENDLMTINPFLAQEWNYERNGDLKPDNVTASAAKRVWWKCSTCGHEWQATIANRNNKRGCPFCSKYRRTSIPEKAIAFYLSKRYRDIESNKKFEWLQNMELDIFIPELMLAIEYDGCAWHKSEERDKAKDKLCYEHGINLIRIREPGLKEYISTALFFITPKPTIDLLYLQPTIIEITDYIKRTYDENCNIDVDVQRDYYEILSLVKKTPKNCSLGEKHPKLLEEWNYERNGNLSPFNLSSGSSRKVWWICQEGHEWRTAIANRTNVDNLNKCPYCQGKKVVDGVNDLVTINPSFLADWDHKKNSLTPNNYMIHSGKVVWWKCHKCGYEWQATVDSRSKHGCVICSREQLKKAKSKFVENIDTHTVYSSATQAEKENNLYAGAVVRCCRGERTTAGGYRWKYVEKENE